MEECITKSEDCLCDEGLIEIMTRDDVKLSCTIHTVIMTPRFRTANRENRLSFRGTN